MSKPQSKIPSPARSHGAITPRRRRTRRTLSMASPARSDASGRLSSVVEKFINNDKFTMSPMKRRSVLPDDTEIEAPRRASWWKRLEGSSRDVLEALDTNKMPDDLLVEEYEFEVQKDQPNQSVVPESSDNESVASIVVPHRRLFNQKKQAQDKFGDIMGSRKSLGRTNIEDISIDDAPKNLFNKGPRNRPVFPAALLNSTNKTINKTVEPETNKQARPNLFGQAGTKRKNMFTDFVLSESEEDSEIQHKIFGFKNKRMSLGTRNRRMPSLTPSMTTEIDIDDWNLLPSSTMIGAPEVSGIITDKEIELAQEENEDNTLTEENATLNPETDHVNKSKSIQNKSLHQTKFTKSIIQNDDNGKTLTNENIETEDSNKRENIEDNVSKQMNKTHNYSKSARVEDKTLQNKSSKRSNHTEEVIEDMVIDQVQGNVTNHQLFENGPSIEDIMADLHGESIENKTNQQNTKNWEHLTCSKEACNSNKDEDMQNMSKKDKSEGVLTSREEHESLNKSIQTCKANHNELMGNISQQNKNEKKIELTARKQEHQGISKEKSQENEDEDIDDTSEKEKSEQKIESSSQEEEIQENSKEESQENQNEHMDDTSEKEKSEEKVETSCDAQDIQVSSKEESQENEDEDMDNTSQKEESEEKIETSCEEQEIQVSSKEESQENEDEDMNNTPQKEKSEEKTETSCEEQEIQVSSKEESQENEDEEMDDTSEKEKSEEIIESSSEELEIQCNSKGETQETQDENMDDTLEKENSDKEIEPSSQDPENLNSSKESSNENQDEDMEELVWDNNDYEKSNDQKGIPKQEKSEISNRTNSSKNISNKSQKIVGLLVREDQIEQENDVIDETPNNSTHDTTGRNRIREISQVKSPEAMLQNITKDNESFRPIGRSTTFRKSKSIIFDHMNIRSSLPPVQESTLGSEGSRNSSTEGSGWDSHRTTRKTIRQTFGKDFTPRKSLRALVMEQSAKRQTELYNKTTANVTKNKTVEDVNNKTSSKMNKTETKTILHDVDKRNASKNKTKNKTDLDDVDERNASNNKTKNKTVVEDAYEKNAAKINKTKNKTVLEDVNDHNIRHRRVSNRNLSRNPLFDSISSAHGTLAHHVSDPLISKPQVYHGSLYDVNELKISNREASINISEKANDSGPEISIHASYGQSMSAEHSDREDTDKDENISNAHDPSDLEISDKENRKNNETSQSNASDRMKSMHVTYEEEMLDYEASDHEQTEEAVSEPEETAREHSSQENVEQDDSVQELSDHSALQEEKEDSEPEESGNEIEPEESENEAEQIEEDRCQQEELESEQEESQQEEPESEQEESQQEIDAESEQESENEDHDMSHESVHDISQAESDQESARNISAEPEIGSDQDDNDQEDSENFVSQVNSQYQMSTSNRTERVVFDNEMSDQEIDYELSERVSRQITDDDISEQESEREPTPELTRSRVSEPSRTHDISVGTKRSMMLMQAEKIAQQNMEIRQKIREKVQNSLKSTTRNCNFNKISPIKSKFSIRRVNKEPKQIKKSQPKPTGLTAALPKAFAEDLTYKPPKRFQPANAPWITKRLYKFLEAKLEPKYDYLARMRAEQLVRALHVFAGAVRRRREPAPRAAVDRLKQEMARLRVVHTHFDFYDFFYEFMPKEVRIKVNPDVVNMIPLPRNGIFAEILPSRSAGE